MKLISTITINNYTLLHTVTHWQLHLVDSCFRHLDSSIHHLMSVCTLVFYSRSLDPEVVWFRLTCFDIILCICKAGFQFSWAGFHCWGVENIPSALWKYLSWKNQKHSTKCSLQFGDSNCICLLTFFWRLLVIWRIWTAWNFVFLLDHRFCLCAELWFLYHWL